jgi:hypothetical protein
MSVTQDSHTASVRHERRFERLQVAGSVRAQHFGLKSVALAPAERAPFAAASFATPPSALARDIAASECSRAPNVFDLSHFGQGFRAAGRVMRGGWR